MRHFSTKHIGIVLIAASSFALSACGNGSTSEPNIDVVADVPSPQPTPPPPQPTPPPPQPVTTAPGETTSVNNMQIGLCGDAVSEDFVMDFAVARDCDDTHAFEVIGFLERPEAASDAFPGQIELFASAQLACREPFETYTGVSYASSELDIDAIIPSPGTWAEGDRTVICLLVTATGEPLETSAASPN